MPRKKKERPKANVRRAPLVVSRLGQTEEEDRRYWAAQTPQARLRALELIRWINYGPAARGRLQRVFEIVQPKPASGRTKDLDDLENLPEA